MDWVEFNCYFILYEKQIIISIKYSDKKHERIFSDPYSVVFHTFDGVDIHNIILYNKIWEVGIFIFMRI